MDLNAVAVFVKVVQAESFSEAARQLSMPKSTVSAQVSRLERRLGVTLLHRTTRKLRLTETGEHYFNQACRAIDAITNADLQASAAQQEPQGILRVTAPTDGFDYDFLAELVTKFKQANPRVGFELKLTQELVDLISDGIDVAIRAGHLKDSRLVARRVGTATWVPLASPSYLQTAGIPTHPRELGTHALLQFEHMGRNHWHLARGKTTISIPMPRIVLANNATIVRSLAISGNGIALLPIYFCRNQLENGELVRVFPEWISKTEPLHLVYPGQHNVSAKVRAFVDFATPLLREVFRE